MSSSLYLLRHAEARPSGMDGDHARELEPHGRRAARLVGRFLGRLGEAPQRVLVSSAVRARETESLARDAGGWRANAVVSDALYTATPDSLLRALQSMDGRLARVLVIAHQPTLGLLIRGLTGGEPEFPPAAMARIDFDVERWSAIEPEGGRLAWLFTPTLLGALS
jgi:phosphohistidine phosphatase